MNRNWSNQKAYPALINQLIESKMPQKVKEIVFSSMTLSRVGNIVHFQVEMLVWKK